MPDPDPMTVSVTVTPYRPLESDNNPGAYLQRCGNSFAVKYGYTSTLQIGSFTDPETSETAIVHQLQINIPDDAASGGIRPVKAVPPQIVVDTSGSIEALTPEQFDTRYGGGL